MARRSTAVGLAILCACVVEDADEVEAPAADSSGVAIATGEAGPSAESVDRIPVVQSARAAPTEIRTSKHVTVVYAEPRHGARVRGIIPKREPFAIGAPSRPPDESCRGEGWAEVAAGGHVCLERATDSDATPATLPRILPGEHVPFLYARLAKTTEATPPPSRWRSRWALYRGDPPEDTLEPNHDYAFVRRKHARVGTVLVDANRRAVKERDLERLRPSTFVGREVSSPLPSDRRPAWTVTWPKTPVRSRPAASASTLRSIAYHQRLEVLPRVLPGGRRGWLELPTGGYVSGKHVRYWLAAPAPAGVERDEIWIDVELGQQTLAVMRGPEPVFVTLVATGNFDNPTPPGLYRIRTKQAYGDMRSLPDDADDPYHVEAVPWVQYFAGRYAIHGAYWHNRFGRRTSHGCINLSPRDAARVYALTTPTVPPGWVSVNEHADDPGTLVRIRIGTEPPPDRRRELTKLQQLER